VIALAVGTWQAEPPAPPESQAEACATLQTFQISKNLVSRALSLAPSFCSQDGEARFVTRNELGPVVDWQQTNAHRPVSRRLLAFPLLVDLALRQQSAQTP
jgi:hypothetical protein